MPRPRSCSPPRTIRVKGHWRKVKRKRKAAGSRTPKSGRWWVVANPTGRTCGHHHRTFTGAVSCRRRMDRAERAYRARHGQSTPRGYWVVESRGKR